MKTPFDLIQRLSAWFLRADRDIALPSGRKITITGANVEITSGGLVITGGNITVSGTVDGVDISAHASNANAHHNRQHALDSASDHTGTLPWASVSKTGSNLSDLASRAHGDLTGLTSGDPHTQYLLESVLTALGDIFVRGSSGITRLARGSNGQVLTVNTSTATDLEWTTPSSGVTDHGDLSGLGDDDHNQYHNNSRGDARYYQQSEFSGNPGASEKPLKSDSSGHLRLVGLGIGEAPTANDIRVTQDVLIKNGLAVGSITENPPVACMFLEVLTSNPAAPSSGVYVYMYDSGGTTELRARYSDGTIRAAATF